MGKFSRPFNRTRVGTPTHTPAAAEMAGGSSVHSRVALAVSPGLHTAGPHPGGEARARHWARLLSEEGAPGKGRGVGCLGSWAAVSLLGVPVFWVP